MREECDGLVKHSGPINMPHVTHSMSGNLKAKFVIHAPIETQATEFTERLTRTFYNCFVYASDPLKMTSLAIPPLAAGINTVVLPHTIFLINIFSLFSISINTVWY